MSMPSDPRDYVRFDELAGEFAERYRRGEQPSVQEYVERLPEMADEIREMFPAMVEIEQAEEDARDDAHRPVLSPPPLREVGDFRIVREVGRGGMGVVYEAVQISLGRRVALKVLPRQVAANHKALERFRREAKSAARLHHTNIVPVFEVGHVGDIAFYAMQFIPGQGLDQVIDELRRLSRAALVHDATSARAEGPVGIETADVMGAAVRSRQLALVAESLLSGQLGTERMTDAGALYATTEAAEIQAFDAIANTDAWAPDMSDLPEPLSRADVSSSAVLPGGTAISSVDSSGRRQPFFRSVALIGRQVAQGLSYAHSRGVVHRDIKPSNLLLDTAGVVWITDFGLAKAEENGLTETGDILGTFRYMAPERFRGEADARADIYALGLILYELLTLKPAFHTSDRLKLIEQVKSHEPARPRSIDDRIPRDLETIVLKASDKDPARRYATGEAMAEDLRRFLDDEPIQARRATLAERYARWARHHPGIAVLGALLTAVLVMATLTSLFQASRFREQWLRAELKTREADEKTQALERQLYINRINLAERDSVLEVAAAEQLLDQCPRALRGWEWNYIKRLCHLERRTLAKHTRSVNTVAFSRDGRWLISGAGERFYSAEITHQAELTLWDARSGRKQHDFSGLKGGVQSAAFSPDSRFVAVGSGYFRGTLPAEGHLTVWDVVTGRLLYDRVESGMNLLSVAFSPDGRWIAAGYGFYSSRVPGRLKLWDARSGTLVHTVEAPPGGVNCVAFSPDGRLLAMACSGVIELWQVDPLKKQSELRGHTSWVYGLAFSPDGARLASGGWDKTIKIWDTAGGTLLLTGEGHSGEVNAVAFSPDGKKLASAGGDNMLRIWDAGTARTLQTFRGHTRAISGLAYSPDGATIATGGADTLVKLWDATNEYPIGLRGHKAWVTGVAFSPDGRRVVSSSGDHTLMLWDPTSGRRLETLEKHIEWVEAVAWSGDGRLIASASGDQFVLLWDAAALWVVKTRNMVPENPKCLAFSPGGHLLAVGTSAPLDSRFSDQPGIVEVWEIAGGRQLPPYHGHKGGVLQLAFSPDGKAIASVGGNPKLATGEVRLWEAMTGRDIRTFSGHTDVVKAVAFSPDARLLATGAQDATVKLWDVRTGRLHRTLRGHTNAVESLAFSPDGSRLATGGLDGAVKLWNVATGDEILTLRGHAAGVVCLAFSPDGGLLISGSIDWTARVWDARPLGQTEQSAPVAD
jgi:WD40 repeat protein